MGEQTGNGQATDRTRTGTAHQVLFEHVVMVMLRFDPDDQRPAGRIVAVRRAHDAAATVIKSAHLARAAAERTRRQLRLRWQDGRP